MSASFGLNVTEQVQVAVAAWGLVGQPETQVEEVEVLWPGLVFLPPRYQPL